MKHRGLLFVLLFLLLISLIDYCMYLIMCFFDLHNLQNNTFSRIVFYVYTFVVLAFSVFYKPPAIKIELILPCMFGFLYGLLFMISILFKGAEQYSMELLYLINTSINTLFSFYNSCLPKGEYFFFEFWLLNLVGWVLYIYFLCYVSLRLIPKKIFKFAI